MLLIAAIFVVTMIVWMNRVARHLKKEIEAKVEAYAEKAGSAAGWGIFLFVFLMVLREGAELALILRPVELSSEGLQTWIGTIATPPRKAPRPPQSPPTSKDHTSQLPS